MPSLRFPGGAGCHFLQVVYITQQVHVVRRMPSQITSNEVIHVSHVLRASYLSVGGWPLTCPAATLGDGSAQGRLYKYRPWRRLPACRRRHRYRSDRSATCDARRSPPPRRSVPAHCRTNHWQLDQDYMGKTAQNQNRSALLKTGF